MEDIKRRIAELEKEISELPMGYVSRKMIKGKERFYLQWNEEGKLKSKYIRNEDYEDVMAKIALRRNLQRRLDELKNAKVDGLESRFDGVSFETKVQYGEELLAFASSAKEYSRRDCYPQIEKYLNGKTEDKVCIVYGLRRTGKTTLLKQILLDMAEEDFSKSVYIKATVKDTMNSLNRDMRKLRELGVVNVFIDEVTLLSDFIDTAAILSDLYCAMGMKIVLSGTDSLGFWLSSYGELYDRAVMVHTTYIPFKEHSRLLRIDDVDEYIQYGGTLKAGNWNFEDKVLNSSDASFRDDETTRAYIDSAICANIQYSLKYYSDGKHYRHLQELYEKNELTSAINRLIEHTSHAFLLHVLTDEFVSHDLGLLSRNLLHARNLEEQIDLEEKLDRDAVTRKLVEILEIKEKPVQQVDVKEVHLEEIHEYLEAMDLLDSVEVRTVNRKVGNPRLEIFTQPGMRFCQAKALVFAMMKDEHFASLGLEEREFITQRLLQAVYGSMLEDIVLLDTKKKVGRDKEVFKLQFAAGEYDMVIFDGAASSCQLFEIKHSDEIVENQYRFLVDEAMLKETERRYGRITRRCVLYKGESGMTTEGVEYKNVEEFLKAEFC